MKKKILFVIDSLHCAGAEKSLTTLLNLIDYNEYEVDLQLFGYGGALESLLPNEVNLLSPLAYTVFSNLSLISAINNLHYAITRFNLCYNKNDSEQKREAYYAITKMTYSKNKNTLCKNMKLFLLRNMYLSVK